MDSWLTWKRILPALEHRYEVFALTLPGHAGGAPLGGEISETLMPDAVEVALDAAGIETAAFAGNSLGGFVALQLAARGRARSVVALAPAGGWAEDDDSYRDLLHFQRELYRQAQSAAAFADALAATPDGRRRAMQLVVENPDELPAQVVVDQLLAVARCDGAEELLDFALRSPWSLDAERITCPVRIVWGTHDRLLPWPSAAARYRSDWLPHADWVELDGIGHAPQLDAPLETAELIAGFAGG